MQSAYIDNQIDQSVQVSNRAAITGSGTLDAQFFGLAVDAFARRALGVNRVIERTAAIKQNALKSSQFPIQILPAPDSFDKLLMIAGGSRGFWKEKRTAELLSTVASGVSELEGGMHAQADGTARHPIGITGTRAIGMRVEGNRSDSVVPSGLFIHIPCIKSSISSQVSRECFKRQNGLLVERAEIEHIAFIERKRVFSQYNIAIVWVGSGGHAGAVAPDEFFFLFGRAIWLFLIGTSLHPEFTVRITWKHFGFVIPLRNVDAPIVLFHPSVDVLDIEGDDLTQTGNLFLEITHGRCQKGLEQGGIKGAQFFAHPILTRERFLAVKAIESTRIQFEVKAQFDNEEGMLEQEAAELTGVDQTFTDTHQKGFDVGDFGMAWSPTRRAFGFPGLDHRPIKQGKEGAVVGDQRISVKQGSDGGLVKESRIGYHSKKLLCVSGLFCCYPNSAKEFLLCQEGFCARKDAQRADTTQRLLATEMKQGKGEGNRYLNYLRSFQSKCVSDEKV